jgi:hypothetical protein
MKKYAILSNGYASSLLHSVADIATHLPIETVIDSGLEFAEDDVLYVPSEDGLNLVSQRTRNRDIAQAIHLFKDKCAFRKKIAPLYPGFYFAECPTDEIGALRLDFSNGKKYVIKPKRGYYATAVKTVDGHSDLAAVQREIKAELAARANFYPGGMLSEHEVIVEEFIGSEIKNSMALDSAELAVDLFYDDQGVPVIVGLYHHPHPTHDRYFHTLYYTNAQIFERFSALVLKFFNDLQSLGMNLRSFPVHAEFKMHNGQLIPIEVNPYRFGGYGLADLMHYVGGVNPYQTYFNNERPDWAAIWHGKTDNYGCIVGYNGQTVDVHESAPDHLKFQAFLAPALLHYEALDHRISPLFGIAFVKTADDRLLRAVIDLEYDHFFHVATAAA